MAVLEEEWEEGQELRGDEWVVLAWDQLGSVFALSVVRGFLTSEVFLAFR